MISKPKKVYYAHPISIYDTAQEKRDITLLEQMGFEILNPNTPEYDASYKKGGMDIFKEAVENCDMLAFRAFPDGSIPAGIAKEIEFAKAKQIAIFELPSRIAKRTLSVESTREYLSEVGYR